MLEKVDKLFIGGGMVFTFLKARGMSVGSSLVEEDKLDLAKSLEKIAAEKGVEIILPSDVVVADGFSADANTQVVAADAIPDGWMGLDAGPSAIKETEEKLADCKCVIWNVSCAKSRRCCSVSFFPDFDLCKNLTSADSVLVTFYHSCRDPLVFSSGMRLPREHSPSPRPWQP